MVNQVRTDGFETVEKCQVKVCYRRVFKACAHVLVLKMSLESRRAGVMLQEVGKHCILFLLSSQCA